jgi:DNA-binding GntR family transcriptional regulator
MVGEPRVVKRDGVGSLAVEVCNRIRREIFNGSLRPGERLQPVALSTRYSTSTTVIREALMLLAGERLVRSTTGKGFSVPEIILEELQDTVLMRCHLESMALRLSIQRGGVQWESALMSAHHQLARTPRRIPEDPDHASEEWSRKHRAFHEQLLAGCSSPIIMDICNQLASATELYRIWAGPAPVTATRNVAEEHAAIVEAAIDGDVELAISLLVTHYKTTEKAILQGAATG